MNVVISLVCIAGAGFLIIKKYKAQTILLMGGMVMMLLAYYLGYTPALVAKKEATGSGFLDVFQYIGLLTAKSAAGLGLMIMVCTGFAKYMDHIGASTRLVYTAIGPLNRVRAPYLVMALTFLINMFMSLVIPSASGLAMLMMVTIFPILVHLGVSPLGAAAAVASGHLLDIGPASATSLLVAQTVGIQVNTYFVDYQLPVYVLCGLSAAISHYFWQSYLDRKSKPSELEVKPTAIVPDTSKEKMSEPGPAYYIVLPLLPLVFILLFSKYGISGIKIDVNVAMFLSLFIAMICEFLRYRSLKKVAGSIQTFFKGMGDQFANTVTLIVAGGVFAQGLESLGVVTAFVEAIRHMSLDFGIVMAGISLIIVLLSVVMGSGVAPMFAFAPLIPNFAKALGSDATTLLLAMQNSASLGRLLSPISAVMIAVAGMAGVSSLDLVKRTSVPVIVAFLVSLVGILVLHM